MLALDLIKRKRKRRALMDRLVCEIVYAAKVGEGWSTDEKLSATDLWAVIKRAKCECILLGTAGNVTWARGLVRKPSWAEGDWVYTATVSELDEFRIDAPILGWWKK